MLLLLLSEPNLLAALEIAQPSFPLLWPSPSETTVVLMKLYASQRVLAELNTLTVSAEQSNLNENKSRANHPSHYIHYFKTASVKAFARTAVACCGDRKLDKTS